MSKMVFSRIWTGRELTVQVDERAQTIAIEADGAMIVLARVDKSGDVIGYKPYVAEEDE